MKRFVFSFTFIFILSFCVSAQENNSKPKSVIAGVVNSKAISLPKPEYPQAAREANAQGSVNVKVTIDEEGDVIAANAVSGHPLLRSAAEVAARQAKFTPTKLSGQPVKVTGTIVYNFVAAQSNEERVKALEIATFLFIARSSVMELEKLNKAFESTDFVKESLEDFPNFAQELAPLVSIKDTPIGKRLGIIDDVIDSIRVKLSPSDAWQFELGQNFGEFFAQLFAAVDGDDFDSTKLNEASLRLNIARIKELIYSAPTEFPADVLEKFKEFTALGDKKSLVTLSALMEMFGKAVAIIETISPEPTK